MNVIDILRAANGGGGLDAIARAHDLEPVQLQAILVTIVPVLARRIEANTLSRGGLADLIAELSRPEHQQLMANAAAAGEPWAAAAGIRALDTVFGDKAHSRALAARAAAQTGVSQDLIQKLLPILASLVMAALAKGSRGGLEDILKRLPDIVGGGATAPGDAQPGDAQPGDARPGRGGPSDGGRRRPPSVPRPEPQGPDYGDGSPLPLPGSRIRGVNVPDDGADRRDPGPLGDLPDVIRKGGVTVDGGSLSSVVRGVLGSLLGFESKGVIGWIVRLIVLRWGWGVLRSILSRLSGAGR